jgi:hypothetical protein
MATTDFGTEGWLWTRRPLAFRSAAPLYLPPPLSRRPMHAAPSLRCMHNWSALNNCDYSS